MERYNDTERTSLWVIAGRVVFTVALIACIWFIFSNSMAVATVSTDSSGCQQTRHRRFTGSACHTHELHLLHYHRAHAGRCADGADR